MFKISNIKLLKAIRYFIIKENYKIVITSTKHDEVFLESISRNDFELICLIDKQYIDEHAFKLDVERVKEIANKLKNKLLKYKIKVAILFTTDNPFVKDATQVEGIKIFTTSNGNFNSPELLSSFDDINENINFSPENTTVEEEFTKTMNEITFYSKQKYESVQTKKSIINFDAHNFLISTILIWNALIFLIIPILLPQYNFSPGQLLNLFGASSFSLTFVNSQYFRPLIAGFLDFSIFGLLISIWIFYSYGKSIKEELGNKGYLAVILLGSYLTYFTVTLFMPGYMFFGPSHLKAVTLGAFFSIYLLKRIEFIKFHRFQARSNMFIVGIILLLSTIDQRAILITGIIAGLVVSFAVISFQKKNFIDFLSTTLVITTLLGFGTFAWNRLPKKPNAYLRLEKSYYDAFDNFYPEQNKVWKSNICKYYDKDEKSCRLF